MSADLAQIAARLTDARKRLILELPADGSWGAVTNRAVARRLWWAPMPVLIHHKHLPTDRNEWQLSETGLSLAQYLRSQANG